MNYPVYSYVGPPSILDNARDGRGGCAIACSDDLVAWVDREALQRQVDLRFWVTYVVNQDGDLLVADRQSEHVVCARGGPVLAAGELAFVVDKDGVTIEEISNQSTGYCPDLACEKAIVVALNKAGLESPSRLTIPIVFRRCESCGERNIVRDGYFVCACCDAALPALWNF